MARSTTNRKRNERNGLGRLDAVLAGLALFACTAVAPHPAPAQTILNTERFQLGEVQGPHLSASVALTGRTGNSEVFIADVSGITGLYREPHWTRLIFGGTYLSDGDRSLLDSRFVQLRHSWQAAARLQTFHFVQVQQNESLRLRSRWLVGSGLQRDLLRAEHTSISYGTGAMLEWERLDPDAVHPDDPTARDRVRMTNLLVLRHETARGLRILNILYFQPRFDVPADFRVLNDLGFSLPVTEKVRLTTSAEWRRDTRPPAGLKKDDVTLKVGVALDFR